MMTEDADGPEEPTRSDGADGSASDGEEGEEERPSTDAATNRAGEGETEEQSTDDPDASDTPDDDVPGESGRVGEPAGSDDEVAEDPEGQHLRDSVLSTDADAGDDTVDESPGKVDESSADVASADERDAVENSGGDGGTVRESRIEEVEPPGESIPDESIPDAPDVPPAPPGDPDDVGGEELTAAEKGMQTVENVGNALGGGGEGPESDQEMPLTAHIEEMMRRLSAVFAVAAVVSALVLFVGSVSPAVPSAAELIRYFWDYHVGLPSSPGASDGYSPYVYGPLEYLLTKLKVVGLAGLLAGLPVFVYQTYRFMRPGLYPHERRYYLAAVPTSLVLGIVGAAFAHFAVLPFVFDYFISYTVGTAALHFGLKETFNLILVMMGYFAIVFQIPLFIQLAIMMGVVTREWLEDRRLIFWGAFLGLALTFISVDPTGFAPIIVVVTMIVLFEGTLALLRWTGN